jgi:ATP-dependent protease ClpP protease subunit
LRIEIYGEIRQSTADLFRSLVSDAHKRADHEKKALEITVALNSPGGAIGPAMDIGRMIRRENAGALVQIDLEGRAICNSACVLILAGAVIRTFEQVGVHRPFFDVPIRNITSEKVQETFQKMLQDVRIYLREMSVSDQLADVMFQTEPQNIKFLSASDAERYGLLAVDPVFREISDLKNAKRLGLDRTEYLRRYALGERLCTSFDQFPSCWNTIMKTGRPPQTSTSPSSRDCPDTSNFSCFGR